VLNVFLARDLEAERPSAAGAAAAGAQP
jgi:hypothetical protein